MKPDIKKTIVAFKAEAKFVRIGIASQADKKAWDLGQQYGKKNKPDLKAKNSEDMYRAAMKMGCPFNFFDVFKYGAQDIWRKTGQLPKR